MKKDFIMEEEKEIEKVAKYSNDLIPFPERLHLFKRKS